MTNTPVPERPPSPATSPEAPRRSRLRGLDGLRFVAAAAVVLFHYTGVEAGFWDGPPTGVFPTLNEASRYGYLGVELFFMVSGFVILMTAYGRSIEGFTASRIARLFPAYWVAVVITVTLQAFWSGGRNPGPVDTLINLTMVQGAFDIPAVQGAFWTLWIELKFYVLIGIFLMIGITARRALAFALLWPVVAQIARATHTGFLNSLLVPEYAPYFAVGMLLFIVYRFGNSLIVWLGIAFNTILCVRQGVAYAPRASRQVVDNVNGDVVALAVVLMVVAIWVVSSGPLRDLSWRWLSVAGALTYPLYLVHGQFGFWVIDTWHDDLAPGAVVAIAVALSLVLAVLLHYGVERRLHDRVRDGVLNGLADLQRRE